MFRNKSQAFVEDWIKVIEADETVWDQNAFNELVRKGQQFMPDDPHHYFKGKTDFARTTCMQCTSRLLGTALVAVKLCVLYFICDNHYPKVKQGQARCWLQHL